MQIKLVNINMLIVKLLEIFQNTKKIIKKICKVILASETLT